MIKLEEIPGYGINNKLKTYNGKNPYILKLKKTLESNSSFKMTPNQINYINDNFDKEIEEINKVIEITDYLANSLKDAHNLSILPKRIFIESLLAETEKTFHVYGKLKRNQEKSEMYFLPKTQIITDIRSIEINLDIDFEKYEKIDTFKMPDGTIGRKLKEHQKYGIGFLLSRDGSILADDMGMGKCLITNELVYTPYGKQEIGTIKVGDYVIGSNGKKTRVLGVYPQPKKELFKITFNDGYSTICCKEHMWTVTSNNGSGNNKNRPVRYTNLTVEQMLDKDLEIEQIGTGWNKKRPYKFKTYYKKSNGQHKWQIPIVKPIQFENDSKLPIDPYLLGVTLGNGHIREDGTIKIELHNSTLSHTKFIPDIYKYASIEDRIGILQGLMDTDGHCIKSINHSFVGTEYCTVSEKLADDVAEIVHSLGGIVRKKSKIGSYKKPDGTKVDCKRVYRLNIKFSNDINPFRLKSKSDEYKMSKKHNISRYISDIEPIGQGETVCIKVDAEDSLFTINHGIVTHNTIQSIIAALESGAKKILIVCPESAKINWEREIKYFGENDISIISGKRWKDAKFVIINYDILSNFHVVPNRDMKEEDICWDNQYLVNGKFDLCIIDEAHYLKDKDSNRGAIMADVTKYIPKVWLLTGTPVANRPMDFYNLLKLIKTDITKNWQYYVKRYCEGRMINKTLKNGKTKKIWLTNGASNLEELASKTKGLYIRRLKTEINDMPEKSIIPLYYELNSKQRSNYDNLWEEYLIERINKKKKGEPDRELVESGILRKYVAMEMVPNTIKHCENIIEQGNSVVIFTNFTDELHKLADYFGDKCVIHYGEMSNSDKQISVDRFQMDDSVNVFIGNIRSAGVALTLTKATYVIFNSFSWVPGHNEQSEDRCIFGGQLVMTNNGYKDIEYIEIGDLVYTHLGNFKPVVDKHSHLERKKKKVDINALGYNNVLSVTNDHKIHVFNNDIEDFEWIESEKIDIYKHRLTLKSNPQPISRKKYLDVINYVNDKFVNSHGIIQKNSRLKLLPEKVELTNELLYAFGFFIAEGWANDVTDKKSSIVSVVQKIENKKMYDASVYIINIIKESFHLNKHSEYIDKNNCKISTIHSKNLAKNFINWFGKGVHNKQLPEWVDELNNEQLEHLLNGYFHGDGYCRKNTQQACTASSKLGSQLVRYVANLGKGVSFTLKDKLYYNIEYTIDTNLKTNKIVKIGDYITYPIKSLYISKPKRGYERVYDLSVEDDHSFVVGNYNVHNCFRIGQKNNVTVYYQLFNDTISTKMFDVLKYKKEIINKIMGEETVDDEKLTNEILKKIINDEE